VTPLRPVLLAAIAAAAIAAVPAALVVLPADASDSPASTPTFHRINVDTAIQGASFTSVGEVFPGEQNIVTSGYGALDGAGRPVGGGTLQLYRPGANLGDWTKVTIFGADAGIIFPNATTIADMDGDGDNDIIMPSGYFFGTDPAADVSLRTTGAITWWENKGPASAFTKHTVVSGQAGSYHGVQLVDLDGDDILDIVSVAEEAKLAGSLTDDAVQTQFFKGNADHTFEAPVVLAQDSGGSQPIVYDVDGDGDLDIISSQYFRTFNVGAGTTFLWLENSDTDGTLTAADFAMHPIATLNETADGPGVGMGFQIRPVPDFREPGTVSWIGTNHVNRCTLGFILPIPEQVIEFVPGDDLTAPWEPKTLSAPATEGPACPTPYDSSYTTYSDQITARYGFGQGAPGVFGYGDLDGDGDVDLAVSGDGDRRLWWIENGGDGTTTLHRLTDEGELFGQAGGAVVTDLDGDGRNEMVFSSYDRNTLAIWADLSEETTPPESPSSSTSTSTSTSPSPSESPTAPPVTTVTVPSSLRIGPETRTVKAGKSARWTVRFTGAPGGSRRTVTVVFDPAKGPNVTVGSIRLSTTSTSGIQQGSFTWRARKAGRFVATYAGTSVSATLRDTRSTDTARLLIR
jgi:hypothetical protein